MITWNSPDREFQVFPAIAMASNEAQAIRFEDLASLYSYQQK